MLIKEEMRRTLKSLEWEADEWNKRAVKRNEQDKLEEGIKDGLRAYALRQSYIQTRLAIHFRSLWDAPLKDEVNDTNSTSLPAAVDGHNERAGNDDNINDDEGFNSDTGDDQDTYHPDDE